jgi:hypothetical protein
MAAKRRNGEIALMLEKMMGLACGIGIIAMGIHAMVLQGYRWWGAYIAYGPFRRAMGVILIVIGGYIVYKEIILVSRKK